MSTSGSFNTNAYNNRRYLTFNWSVKEQSIAENYTDINWSLVGAGATSSPSYYTSGNFKVVIDGEEVYFSSSRINLYSGTEVASGTKRIYHNSDGNRSFSAYAEAGIYTTAVNCTGSGSWDLEQIKRASQPSLITYPQTTQDVTIGSNITIHMNRASANFLHTVRYVWGKLNATIATGVADNCSWTIPMNFCNIIPNATSGIGTIYVDTYYGNTLIGTKNVGFTGWVPNSVVPTINSINISEGNSQVPSAWGIYVQNKSKLKIVASASGSYGSSITNYKTEIIDKDNVVSTYNSNDFTSNALIKNGTYKIRVTATDTRGKTISRETTITSTAYWNPTVTNITINRCTSNGTTSDDGTCLKYSFSASVATLSGKNPATYKLGYKKSSDNSYTYVTINVNVSNVVLSNVTFDTNYSYDIVVTAQDTFMTASDYKELPTGFTLMNFHSSGKSMAIGKVSEAGANEKLFEVGMKTIIENDSHQVIDINSKASKDESSVSYSRNGTQKWVVGAGAGCNTSNEFGWWYGPDGNLKMRLDQYGHLLTKGSVYGNNSFQGLGVGSDTKEYWSNLKSGWYWYGNTGAVPNMPQPWGFVHKIGFSGSDFTVMFYTQSTGGIYRKSGSSAGMTEWRLVSDPGNMAKKTSCMTVSLNTRTTLSIPSAWSATTIPLNTINSNGAIGDGFTIVSNGIKVNRKMKALVSGQVAVCNTNNISTEFDVNIVLDSNGANLGSSCGSAAYLFTHTIPPTLIEINANDIIRLKANVGAAGNFDIIGHYTSTYLTIQEVCQ